MRAPSQSVAPSSDDPLALDPESPFFLVARGDDDLRLSVTEVGAFVTHLSCKTARDHIDQKFDHRAPSIEPWFAPLHIRRSHGNVWLDDPLAQTPVPEWDAYDALVEARSPDDIWVLRLPWSQWASSPAYFHWDGSSWEKFPNGLGPRLNDLVPAALLDWRGTKLVPLVPWPGALYKQRRLPLFAAWDRRLPPPSFVAMSATEPLCRDKQYFDKYRYSFAALAKGEVFVVERPCNVVERPCNVVERPCNVVEQSCNGQPKDAATRVGCWSKGKVTVDRFPDADLGLTAGRLGNSETMLLSGVSGLPGRPLLSYFDQSKWVPIPLPPNLLPDESAVTEQAFDGAGALWIVFDRRQRIWRYDGTWKAFEMPELTTYVQMATIGHGELWASAGKSLYRLHDERWVRVPLFRHASAHVEVLQANPDDVWVRASPWNSNEVRIYRNRRMPLFEPCP